MGHSSPRNSGCSHSKVEGLIVLQVFLALLCEEEYFQMVLQPACLGVNLNVTICAVFGWDEVTFLHSS